MRNMSAARCGRSLFVFLSLSVALFATLFAAPKNARAGDRDLLVPAGNKGTLAIDQISGFRASMVDGISYAGPLGFVHSQASENVINGTGSQTTYSNTLWFTPSADYFVIDHLSVGGLIEISTTWGSVDTPLNQNATQNFPLPQTTSFTILPRVGYLVRLGDRFAIWPRLGVGYARNESVVATGNVQNEPKDAFSAVVFDLDVGLIYRLTEQFFVRADPDLVFTVGGSHSQSIGNQSQSANASYLQASAAFGIGVFFDLH